MVVRKVKKVTKYRAHTTHGGGHRKKRRGAGSRGGRGNAGSGKRAGHKRQGVILGRFGFRPRRMVRNTTAVNVSYFTDERIAILLEAKKAQQEGDAVSIDLSKLGIVRLLGTGSINNKVMLTVAYATAKAIQKVKSAGGDVISQN